MFGFTVCSEEGSDVNVKDIGSNESYCSEHNWHTGLVFLEKKQCYLQDHEVARALENTNRS